MWSDLCCVEQSDLWTNLNFLPEPQIKFVLKFIKLFVFLKPEFFYGIKEENIKSRLKISTSEFQSLSNVDLSSKRKPPKRKERLGTSYLFSFKSV